MGSKQKQYEPNQLRFPNGHTYSRNSGNNERALTREEIENMHQDILKLVKDPLIREREFIENYLMPAFALERPSSREFQVPDEIDESEEIRVYGRTDLIVHSCSPKYTKIRDHAISEFNEHAKFYSDLFAPVKARWAKLKEEEDARNVDKQVSSALKESNNKHGDEILENLKNCLESTIYKFGESHVRLGDIKKRVNEEYDYLIKNPGIDIFKPMRLKKDKEAFFERLHNMMTEDTQSRAGLFRHARVDEIYEAWVTGDFEFNFELGSRGEWVSELIYNNQRFLGPLNPKPKFSAKTAD